MACAQIGVYDFGVAQRSPIALDNNIQNLIAQEDL
jgi:hypothetical protein